MLILQLIREKTIPGVVLRRNGIAVPKAEEWRDMAKMAVEKVIRLGPHDEAEQTVREIWRYMQKVGELEMGLGLYRLTVRGHSPWALAFERGQRAMPRAFPRTVE